ncbi:MAG TPA: hypothetical protein VFM70_11430 [Salinimicrobium sp.]|nr:hypothetical protein [Salinimicrobium sp.]
MGRKTKNNTGFYKKFWVQATGVVTVIVGLIGIGIKIGEYKEVIGCDIRILEIKEKYQTKIDDHKETCKAIQIGNLEDGVKDLDDIVDFLKGARYEE